MIADDGKFPYYRFYPRDFIADGPVMQLEPLEELMYRRLLDYQWLNGSVPNVAEKIAKASRFRLSVATRLWPAIEQFFPASPDGDRRNRRLERERETMIAARKKKVDAGVRGMEIRYHRDESEPNTTTNTVRADTLTESNMAVAVAVAVPEEDITNHITTPRANEARLRELLPANCHAALRKVLMESGRGADGAALSMCQMLDPNDGSTGPDGRPVTADELGRQLQRLAGMPSPGWGGGGFVRKGIAAERAGTPSRTATPIGPFARPAKMDATFQPIPEL